MAYSTGIMNKRVLILNKVTPTQADFGETTQYEVQSCVWANVTWNRGVKALREGALDSYDTVMFRMRYNSVVTRESRILYEGVTYQIQSLHADQQDNIVQITATEIIK
jgi:SPP1 family predicted phage head-tail adaptor